MFSVQANSKCWLIFLAHKEISNDFDIITDIDKREIYTYSTYY